MGGSQGRLLVVESDPRALLATRYALRALGSFHVDEAVDGPDALRQVGNSSFDLVLLSATLPVTSAAELVRALRRTSPEVEVVMLGRRSEDTMRELAEAGVSMFLPRPFGLAALDATLHRLVAAVGVKPRGVSAGSQEETP